MVSNGRRGLTLTKAAVSGNSSTDSTIYFAWKKILGTFVCPFMFFLRDLAGSGRNVTYKNQGGEKKLTAGHTTTKRWLFSSRIFIANKKRQSLGHLRVYSTAPCIYDGQKKLTSHHSILRRDITLKRHVKMDKILKLLVRNFVISKFPQILYDT